MKVILLPLVHVSGKADRLLQDVKLMIPVFYTINIYYAGFSKYIKNTKLACINIQRKKTLQTMFEKTLLDVLRTTETKFKGRGEFKFVGLPK